MIGTSGAGPASCKLRSDAFQQKSGRLKSARIVGICFLLLSTYLFASAWEISSLKAQPIGVSDLHGCWKQDALEKFTENIIAFSVVCFRTDRTAYHFSVSPWRGYEQFFDWKLDGGDLVIDDQSCDADLRGSHLFLGSCHYTGAWIRQCTQMNGSGKGCAGGVEAKALVGDRLHGCWKQGSSKAGSLAFSELCFRSDQSIDRGWMLEDGPGAYDGGSDSLWWRFGPPDQLIISGQSCRVLPGSDDKHLFLSRCVFMGVWLRQN